MYPLVSVIMPLYNCEAYVRQAVESILEQRFTDFELIILDDVSPDRSACIAESFKDSRIRFFRNVTNLGAEPSRNKAICSASTSG